jgi:hypothetical protein
MILKQKNRMRVPSYNPLAHSLKTSNYTLTMADDQINSQPSGAALTITLPSIQDTVLASMSTTKSFKIVNDTVNKLTSLATDSDDVFDPDGETVLTIPPFAGAQIIVSSTYLKNSSGKGLWDIDFMTDARVRFSGILSTVGGSAVETFTVNGLATTDVVSVTINASGATPVDVLACHVSAANTLEVTFTSNPSSDHKINVTVWEGKV